MNISKFRLALVTLLAATIIWCSALFYTLEEHRKLIEWLESDECPPVEKIKYRWDGWEYAYCNWNGGKYVCLAFPALLVAWLGFILSAIIGLRQKREKAK